MPLPSGWEAFITALIAEKTRMVFVPPGIPAGLRAAIASQPALRLVETSKPAQMALGFAQAAAEPAVCFGGLDNLHPGIQQAKNTCASIIAVSLDAETAGADSAAKWSFRVSSPDQIPWCLRRAFSIASNGQPGPVLLEVPAQTGSSLAEIPACQPAQRGIRSSGDLARVIAAAFLLVEARNPLLIAGRGARLSGAQDDLRQLAELLGMPVLTTPAGRAILPEEHPLALGHSGNTAHPLAKKALRETDLLVTVGARDIEIHHSGRVIQIDVEPFEIGRAFVPDLPIIGDAKLVLADILSAILSEVKPKPEWQIRGANWAKAKQADEESLLSGCGQTAALSPCQALLSIQQACPPDTLLVYPAQDPNLAAFSAPFFRAASPQNVLPVGLLSGPVADGIQLAMPAKKVLCVSTSEPDSPPAQPLTWLVLNQLEARPPSSLSDLARHTAASVEDLRQALSAADQANQQGQPALIEILTARG